MDKGAVMPYQFLVRPPLLGFDPRQYVPMAREGTIVVRAYACAVLVAMGCTELVPIVLAI